jgi:hypothetical protein
LADVAKTATNALRTKVSKEEHLRLLGIEFRGRYGNVFGSKINVKFQKKFPVFCKNIVTSPKS